MQFTAAKKIKAIAACTFIAVAAPAVAETTHTHDSEHTHTTSIEIYKGYFDDGQIQARELSDWAGDWQSVYPILQNGTLDEVMEHKAEHGERTAEEYKAYYETGYLTDVDRILFQGDTVTFFRGGDPVQAEYKNDGYEVLTYEAGNRGVRYVFKKVRGDSGAPEYFQFSDHRIAPAKADHFHLYWGDDRAALLEEITNWPTYYPADLSGADIAAEMLAH
jgi:zinc transport system substrate-binding protein